MGQTDTEAIVQIEQTRRRLDSELEELATYLPPTAARAKRGAAILAAARHGLPVHEYAPRRVKQAVVGRGAADKRQVAFMVRVLLGMRQTPPADAADAIAIGITHFHALDAARARKVHLPTI